MPGAGSIIIVGVEANVRVGLCVSAAARVGGSESISVAIAVGMDAGLAFSRGCGVDGAIITASRSIIYAFDDMKYIERFTSEWDKCIEQACKDFVAEVNRARSA